MQNTVTTATAPTLATTSQTMSSLEIAKLTGKQHRHVLADIRKTLEEAEIRSADFSALQPFGNNRTREVFNLPRLECDLVISGYSIKYRLAIIKRWHELEVKLSSIPLQLPATLTPAQKQHLHELVDLVAATGKQTHAETWSRLHRKFHVNSYHDLPSGQFDAACTYLRGKMDGGDIKALVQKHLAPAALPAPQPAPFTPEQIAGATDAATQAFTAVLKSGADWKYHCHRISFITDSSRGAPAMVFTTHERDETINATVNKLARQLLHPNGYPVEPFLPLWEAVNTRLTGRILQIGA